MDNKRGLETPVKLYWSIFVFLLMVIVLLVTGKVGNSKDILDKVTFAATISSILLAVIAIFFSIVQANKGSEQEGIVRNTLIEINSRVEELAIIKDQLSALKEASDLNNDSINEMKNLITDSLDKVAEVKDDPAKIETIKNDTIERINRIQRESKSTEAHTLFANRELIMNLLEEKNDLSSSQISDALGISRGYCLRLLSQLISEGKLEKISYGNSFIYSIRRAK